MSAPGSAARTPERAGAPPSEPPEVLIGLPPDFHDLPLAADGEQWDGVAERFLAMVPVERPPEYKELALAHLRAYSRLLASGGVVKAAACLGTSGGELSTASVLLSWLPAGPGAPADVAAVGLLAALTEQHPDRDVVAIELPVGPAVAVIAERWLAGEAPGADEPVRIPVRSIEVSIPVDEQPWVLVVALSSPSVADWDNYESIMAVICRSIRFDAPPDVATHPATAPSARPGGTSS